MSPPKITHPPTPSSSHPVFPEQVDMIRHGDVVTVTFRTVLIAPAYYDKVADLDIREEIPCIWLKLEVGDRLEQCGRSVCQLLAICF